MRQITLLDAVKSALNERKETETWKSLAAGSGLDLNWLLKFYQGCIDDPGVKKIERLARYLGVPVVNYRRRALKVGKDTGQPIA